MLKQLQQNFYVLSVLCDTQSSEKQFCEIHLDKLLTYTNITKINGVELGFSNIRHLLCTLIVILIFLIKLTNNQ